MAIGTTQSASNLKLDFMNLLVTQMQNQNPLEPMSNEDMSAQLAQFSQLEQMENLNTSFDQILQNSKRNYAHSLIGKEVSFIDMESFNEEGNPGLKRNGQVVKIEMFGDMEILKVAEVDSQTLEIKEYDVKAEDITSTQLDQFKEYKEFEQLSNLNYSFDQVLNTSRGIYANGLIGKQVSFVDMDSDDSEGNPGLVRFGRVTGVNIDGGNEALKITEVNPETGDASEYTIDAGAVKGFAESFG